MKRPFLPKNKQGIVIDILVILANLTFLPILTKQLGNLFNRSFGEDRQAFLTLGGLMVSILFGRLAGLYLKRFPLQSRLEDQGHTSFTNYFFLLNIAVVILTGAFVVTLVSAIGAELRFLETGYNGIPKETAFSGFAGLGLMIVIMGSEIWLLYRLSKPLSATEKKLREKGDPRFGWTAEYAADFGLFTYMMVWQVFYSSMAVPVLMEFPNGPPPFSHYILSVIFLFILFLLFYLSPRSVFLVEDRKHIGTWAFIFGVFAASILRYAL